MSKLFFKGRIDAREDHRRFGYNTKRKSKPGTLGSPLSLIVTSLTRQQELELILQQHSLHGTFVISDDGEENLTELEAILNKPKTQTVAATQSRNDPCSCASGKKFKKCCGQ
ncbi:MAG: SWIM/SEC-C metal-binding protein [Paraglaciecola sp.]|jgi:SWIM/SEC-C metal-binding protein